MVVLVVVGVIGLLFYAASESGLPHVLQRIERLTDGRLQVSGASGSLLSTFRAQELRWTGTTTAIVARDVLVTWSPRELLRRRLQVDTLGARQITLAFASGASAGASSGPALPTNLGLPLTVNIDHASVTTLDWSAGARRGTITGLAFSYQGNATEHRFSSLLLGFTQGHVAGEVTMGASAPFATTGRFDFTGSDPLDGVVLATTLAGPLAALELDAKGRADTADLTATALLTPFAATPLERLRLDAQNVNLARFVATLPDTSFLVRAEVHPVAAGFGGTLEISNASPGSFDSKRLPVTNLTTAFVQTADSFDLKDLNATLAGGGRATGNGRVALAADHASTWSLTLADVDLRALYGELVPTRIAGRVDASIDRNTQRIAGTLTDRGRALTLDFGARVANGVLELQRAQLRTAAGTLTGNGRIAFDGARAFALTATAARFNPAQLGRFPAGSLDGDLRVSGVLAPAWTANVDLTLAPSSKLAGLPARAKAHATVSARAVASAAVDASLGSAELQLNGSVGRLDDSLHYKLAVPDLAAVAVLLPATLPRPLKGALHAEGALTTGAGGIWNAGAVMHAHAENLEAGEYSVHAARIEGSIAAAHGDANVHHWSERSVALDATFDSIGGPVAIRTLSGQLKGTLAEHTLALDVAEAHDSLALNASGGLVEAGHILAGRDTKVPQGAGRDRDPAVGAEHASAAVSGLAWRGSLTRLDTAGALALHLAAPATVEASSHHFHIAGAALTLDKGRIDIEQFTLADGRVTTAGHIAAVPLLSLTTLAGFTTPIVSTVKLGGAWSIAAAPHLNGTFSLHREDGDLFATDEENPNASDYSLGISTLAIDGSFHDDALELSGRFESKRAGVSTLALSVAAGSKPGQLATNAPLKVALHADLASLAAVQPWLGTTAVIDGRALVDVAATGTLATPLWSGTLAADGLRLNSPQWGLQWIDGRVRATLLDNAIRLDEFSVTGGEGHLTATGTLARSTAQLDGAVIHWKAEHFRLFNRPDRRLVVNGEGTAAARTGRLSLVGSVRVEDGHVAFEPPPRLLGDDVVIKGRPPAAPGDDRLRATATILDLDVDLGRKLSFEAEGLETRLEGKVRVTTGTDGLLYGKGTIRAVEGTYYAFGQRLSIERGQLLFNGLLNNPALDVVAMRRNLAVEAGVEVTGTVRVPRIQLTSNPPMSDGEKLSWLITGQAPGSSGGSDAAALAAASAMLLGNGGRPISSQVAQRFGLDDISVQSDTTGNTANGTSATRQVIAFGKRINDRITLVYEQGLTVATNALRLEYRLSRTLTLRAEAGLVSGIGLVFRRSWD
jgi:translocation and assembly module TamB